MILEDLTLNQIIRDTITISPNATLLEARNVLLRNKVTRLPVIDDNKKPVGIITEKDLVRAIYRYARKLIEKILVEDFMSKNLVTVTRDEDFQKCAKLMQQNKISSVLVIEKDGTLAGIITKTDLASVFLTRTMKPELISDIMTKKVVTVMPADPLLFVESLLVKYRLSRVVVQRNKKPVGIITNRDFLPAKMPRWIRQFADPEEVEDYRLNPKPDEFKMNQLSYLLSFRAEDIMTPNPITVESNKKISDAVLLMIKNGISGLPVVKKSVLVGIVTKSDIVRSIAEN